MSMDEVGIRLRLETGDAVANANQATEAIDSLGKALEKAAIAGNAQGVIDYANAINKYKSAVGLEEDKKGREQKPTALKVVEDATKVISRAPGYIGAIGGGNAAGAALGAASDAANLAKTAGLAGGLGTGAMVGLGVGAALVGIGVAANKLSEQWEKQIPQAMELTATLGRLTGEYKTNSLEFQRAFNLAGQAADQFGYTLEEGMATVSQLAKLGARSGGTAPYTAAERVFAYERGTGADRGTLMRAEAEASRYGVGPNALGYALGGTYAQGLQTAQFQEYLNATLKIFEDGLSRGVIKGFDEITRTQNFIALLGNGSPLWKGEQGYQRYQTMNQQFTAASFESDYDVVRYRATEAVLKEAAARGYKNDKEGAWSKYRDYGDINKDGYLAVQRAREGGLTPEIFSEVMKILENEIAAGSYANLTEAVIKVFGVNYTAAQSIIGAFNSKDYKNATAIAAAPSSATSPELSLLTTAQEIRKAMANAGADVLPSKVEVMSVLRGILNGVTGDRVGETYKREMPLALDAIFGEKTDAFARGAAEKLLNDALKDAKKGIDTDKNGISDNAEAAMKIIGYLEGLPEDVRHTLDASGLLDNLWKGKTVNDLPGIADYLTKEQYKDKKYDQAYKGYTSKEPLKISDVQGMTNKFDQYMPNWQKEYPDIPTLKQAAIDNEPGAIQLYKEITTRMTAIESKWQPQIESAKKAAGADNKITPQEQKGIDQLEAGRDKELKAFLEATFGPLNSALRVYQDKKSEGGEKITPEEWQRMLKLFYPQANATPENAPTVQLSKAEGGKTQETTLPVSLSGASMADAILGKIKTSQPFGIASTVNYQQTPNRPYMGGAEVLPYGNRSGFSLASLNIPTGRKGTEAPYQISTMGIPEMPRHGWNDNADEARLVGLVVADAIAGRLRYWQPPEQAAAAVGRLGTKESGQENKTYSAPQVARNEPLVGLQALASYSFLGSIIANSISDRLGSGNKTMELLGLLQSQNRVLTAQSINVGKNVVEPGKSEDSRLPFETIFDKQFMVAMRTAPETNGKQGSDRLLEEVLSRLSVAVTQVASAANEAGRDIKQAATTMVQPIEIVLPANAMNVGRA